jgi:hypothetical protein
MVLVYGVETEAHAGRVPTRTKRADAAEKIPRMQQWLSWPPLPPRAGRWLRAWSRMAITSTIDRNRMASMMDKSNIDVES